MSAHVVKVEPGPHVFLSVQRIALVRLILALLTLGGLGLVARHLVSAGTLSDASFIELGGCGIAHTLRSILGDVQSHLHPARDAASDAR